MSPVIASCGTSRIASWGALTLMKRSKFEDIIPPVYDLDKLYH
jgi:hypothetical protein